MVGLQTLDLAIGVRVPASQPNKFEYTAGGSKSEPPLLCAASVCAFPRAVAAHDERGVVEARFIILLEFAEVRQLV